MKNNSSLYDLIGGAATVERIVNAFYPLVQQDKLLAPLFPQNIDPVMEKQVQFLTQFFGGPPLFSDEHGHPMMRARHLPFAITREHADAWLNCMSGALLEIGMPEDTRAFILERLSGPAYHFVNTDQEGSQD